jgi:hypothetical protein
MTTILGVLFSFSYEIIIIIIIVIIIIITFMQGIYSYVCWLFVFLALQPTVVVFSQPDNGF